MDARSCYSSLVKMPKVMLLNTISKPRLHCFSFPVVTLCFGCIGRVLLRGFRHLFDGG
jgi:hypothetical protein